MNRSETRVELLFDVARSPSLENFQREKLLERLSSRLDKYGILHLASQASRSQARNRDELVERFRELIARSLAERPTRRRTRPSRAARERRLQSKKKRSDTKRLRRPPEA